MPTKISFLGSTMRIRRPTASIEIIVPTPRGAITMPVVTVG